MDFISPLVTNKELTILKLMVCVEVSNMFVIVYNEVSKEVCMMLVTCLGQAFVHGSIFLSHHRLPRANTTLLNALG